MSTYDIYLVKSPSNRFYVGITSNFIRRKYIHHKHSKNGSKLPFHHAIRKYGDKMEWSIIDRADNWESACEKEKMYIQKYDSYKLGYNKTLGGDGTVGLKCPDHLKKVFSQIMTGMKRTESNKLNCSLGKGGKRFEVTKIDGSLVGIWQNLRQCERDLNIPKPHIWRCLRGLRKSTRDLKFRYIED